MYRRPGYATLRAAQSGPSCIAGWHEHPGGGPLGRQQAGDRSGYDTLHVEQVAGFARYGCISANLFADPFVDLFRILLPARMQNFLNPHRRRITYFGISSLVCGVLETKARC